jgi:photosystem II stability/assembly factor-like uncharacterized protein
MRWRNHACAAFVIVACAPSPPSLVTVPPAPQRATQTHAAWRWAKRCGGPPLNRIWGARDVLIAVGDHGTILRSTDAGVSFTPVASGTKATLTAVYGSRATDVYVAGDHGTLLTSSDRGMTWRALPSPAPEIGALWVGDEGRVVLLGTPVSILRSVDRGQTWTPAFTDAACGTFADLRRDDIGRLWAGGVDCIARSADEGVTWTRTLFEKQSFFESVTFRALWRDEHTLVAVGWTSVRGAPSGTDFPVVRRSTDDGVTWGPPQQYELFARDVWGDGLGTIVVGDTGKVTRTIDHGAHWFNVGVTSRHRQDGVWATHTGALVMVGVEGIIRRSTDGGSTWNLVNATTAGDLDHAWLRDDGVAFAAGLEGFFGRLALVQSGDGGATWKELDARTTTGLEEVYAASSSGEAAVVTHDQEIYRLMDGALSRSTDSGKTWKQSPVQSEPLTPETQQMRFRSLWRAPNGDLFSAALAGGVARSTNDGETWMVNQDKSLGDLIGVGGTKGCVIVAGKAGVFRSIDGGVTFTNVLPKGDWRAVASGGPDVWVLGAGRVARSADDGVTWSVDDLPADTGKSIAVDGHEHAIVVGLGGSVLRYP